MKWAVNSQRYSYSGEAGFAQLRTQCEQHATVTELVPLKKIDSLFLHPTAFRTPDGYQFNIPAFRQIAGELDGNLASLLTGLSTATALPDDRAIQGLLLIYNAAVKLAGQRLIGRRLVVDSQNNVVVGLVGKHYKFVGNSELLQMAERYFKTVNTGYSMLKAELNNRDLFLLCASRYPASGVGQLKFRQGLAVYNSETTRRAIFIPRVIFDTVSQQYSMESEDSHNRMIHRRKKKFAEQLDKIVVTAFQSDNMLPSVLQRYGELSQSRLFTTAQKLAALRSIESRLVGASVNATPSHRVVSLLQDLESPTQWDLYRALVRAAGEFRSSDRVLRMLAFDYLLHGVFAKK